MIKINTTKIYKSHLETVANFAIWARDNNLEYCIQGPYGEMFKLDDKEYSLEDLINKFVKEEYGE